MDHFEQRDTGLGGARCPDDGQAQRIVSASPRLSSTLDRSDEEPQSTEPATIITNVSTLMTSSHVSTLAAAIAALAHPTVPDSSCHPWPRLTGISSQALRHQAVPVLADSSCPLSVQLILQTFSVKPGKAPAALGQSRLT